MSNPIVIGIAVVNAPPDVDAEEIMRFIDAGDGDFETYELAPPPPGVGRKAAFDFTMILGAVRSVASIASLLWMAYDKFIAPKKTRQSDDAGLYVGIKKPDGTVADYWIDKSYKDKDIFIEEFTTTVTSIRKSKDAGYFAAAGTEIRQSGVWIRRK